ncbi:MAG TPA: sodium:proton exchanger, partial [Desulfobacteraceae bacterium]|nr:sodium:proton exchanger [Desulfobacteraceae bacterium]
PLIVMIIMGLMGYRRRTGFLAGLTVAQISEFSLIVAALGLSIGHITNETMGLITFVGVVTIFVSTYMILYSYQLYRFLSGPLKIFERRNPYREAAIDTLEKRKEVEVILVGLGNYGSGLLDHLVRREKAILGVDFDPIALDKWRQRGVTVIYGDVADPDMHEQLPLNKARWVISTVRSKELNLALINTLRKDGYSGKVALTATNSQEATEFEKAGAHLVFRPFRDATEQAADSLTYAMGFLPENVDWPISFLELRIRSDASAAGQTIRELPLSESGISVLAVSRGGRVYYEPKPDFRIFPADRLLLMGHPGALKDAESIVNQLEIRDAFEDEDRFEIAEISVLDDSDLSGRSLADILFRQKYGVTLVGIRRGQNQITKINPSERLQGGDCLIVIGKSAAVKKLKEQSPL